MIIEQIRYALNNIWLRKMRSSLSILSILIGVTSIFTLISFGLGLQDYTQQLANEAGADKLFVQARGGNAAGLDDTFALSEDDLEVVKDVRGVDVADGIYIKGAQINVDNQQRYVFLAGFDPENADFIEEAFTVDLESGRRLKDGDIQRAVFGYNYLLENEIFEDPLEIGQKVFVNGYKIEVTGFYTSVGNPQDDSNIYMTPQGVELIYPDTEDRFSMIMVRADSNTDVDTVADRIEDDLRKAKNQEEGKEDFFVQTFADQIAIFGNIIGVINGILILIALISVVVATVNIMNTMYTAVLERTKEIGIMKAIGARNSYILFIFVLESGLLGLIGGILGIMLGYLFSTAGGIAAASAGYALLQPIYPISLILGCIMFSFGIGAMAGVLPARQASAQKPVEALRYE